MADPTTLQFQLAEPEPEQGISDFVYCFSAFDHPLSIDGGIIIPNGKIDLVFSLTGNGDFNISLLGLETQPKTAPAFDRARFFSISFQPLAIEYILRMPVAGLLNSGRILPGDFWGFGAEDMNDFQAFIRKATDRITSLIPEQVDRRKRDLFHQITVADGDIRVGELSEKIGWSSRRINGYFNTQLGLSLKAYCNILRFQASLQHIKEGELYPQLNYTDQSHFIKEVKKLSGVSPKELSKNENSRFLQFLVYGKP